MVEEDTDYARSNLNSGLEDQRQSDAMSCKAFCKSNYQSARYFTWVSPSVARNEYFNTCWCKQSDSGKKDNQGVTSGEVTCGDKGNENQD